MDVADLDDETHFVGVDDPQLFVSSWIFLTQVVPERDVTVAVRKYQVANLHGVPGVNRTSVVDGDFLVVDEDPTWSLVESRRHTQPDTPPWDPRKMALEDLETLCQVL